MKALLLVLAGCVALTSPSFAESMSSDQRVIDGPGDTDHWTGLHAGFQAGSGWGDTDFTGSDTAVPANFRTFTAETRPSGLLAGGHAGALFQWRSIVFGVEADAEYNGMRGSGAAPFLAGDGTSIGQIVVDAEYDFSASVRGRLGYAFDRVLIYGTGGYAYADIRFTSTGTDNAGNTQSSTFEKGFGGWTAGGGVDVFVTPGISAGVEYRYTSLAEGSVGLQGAAASLDSDYHAVRARIGFHF